MLKGTLAGIITAIPKGILRGIRKESLTNPPTQRVPYGILTGILEGILISPKEALKESVRKYLGIPEIA